MVNIMPKNIAILTMSMDIGGAETHIYELACSLAKHGHNITVFSAGGSYVPMLEKNGVKHIYAPLNSKNPHCLIESYKTVSNYVKATPQCILHSHTRISNYTADIVSKRFGVPFVTTIHGKFTTGFFQRLFTRWGIRALCVSDDLKSHTIEHYGLKPEQLSVTVNGINLETFSKRDGLDFKKELGYKEQDKIILCVSRLNDTASNHIEKVISISEELYNKNPNTKILIVGDGDRFNHIKQISEKLNNKIAPNFIKLVGARTDVYKFCNIADLFIGISRSALEAIACKVPVILLGNTGYIGMLTEKTRQACIDTNFTCRGFPYPENSKISSLAAEILENPHKFNDSIEYGYELVKSIYSVDKMANDAIDMYNAAQNDVRDFDIMLCGYYGRRNLGDDILLQVITENLKNKCNVDKSILLTADTANVPSGLNGCIHRFNIPAIKKYMKRTKVFLLGGGSILQDATSSRSLYYYIYVTKLAKKMGCKILLYSNGIGPINKEIHRTRVAKLLEDVEYITVRDQKSFEYMRKIGVKNKNIEVTADEVFTMNTQTDVLPLDSSKKYICVNLKNANSNEAFIKSMAIAIDRINKEYGYTPVLLPMHFNQDINALTKLSHHLKCKKVFINKPISHNKTLAILNQSEFAVVERLHAIIFSCIFNHPFVAINYDPKVHSLCLDLEMEEYLINCFSYPTPDSNKLYKTINNMINNNEQIKNKLYEKAKEKRILAENNVKAAQKIFD